MKTNKLVNCPQCGGFGFTSTPVSTDYEITVCRAKTCELCHGAGVIEAPMTNADRIRAMTDEELGVWICKHALSCGCCVGVELCRSDDGIANGAVKWLQQPAEEDKHEDD